MFGRRVQDGGINQTREQDRHAGLASEGFQYILPFGEVPIHVKQLRKLPSALKVLPQAGPKIAPYYGTLTAAGRWSDLFISKKQSKSWHRAPGKQWGIKGSDRLLLD